MSAPIRIEHIEAFCLRAEVDGLPTSSLGTMAARNGLLVRVQDGDGGFGWGEIWCNFPPHAGQSRKQLLDGVIAPDVLGKSFEGPGDVRKYLEGRWSIMATHVGEPGPFGHCIAGLDMAAWDLAARRAGRPMSHFLAEVEPASVKVYASTLNPNRASELAQDHVADGHRAFKLKVGIDPGKDDDLVRTVREAVGTGPAIMVDANQTWSVTEAVAALDRLSDYQLTFAEEPIAAATPLSEWARLAEEVATPLAAGENICADAAYADHLQAGALAYYQPDVAKWGGIGGCYAVGRKVIENGRIYCPHYMGTGVGLAASLHLLAAVGGEGFVELDSNDNPLRTDLCDLNLDVTEGRVRVPRGDGIGVVPDVGALARYQVN